MFTQMFEIVSTERGAYPILIGVWPYFKNHFGRGYVFIEQKFIRCLFLLWISRTMRLRKFVEIQWKQSSLLLVLSQQVVPWWFNKKGPISKNNIQHIYAAISFQQLFPKELTLSALFGKMFHLKRKIRRSQGTLYFEKVLLHSQNFIPLCKMAIQSHCEQRGDPTGV